MRENRVINSPTATKAREEGRGGVPGAGTDSSAALDESHGEGGCSSAAAHGRPWWSTYPC